MGHAGQWWARLGTERQFGYLQNDLGQVVFSASSSTSLPSPKGNRSLRSLPVKKIWWLWLCVQHMPPIKRSCQNCKLFSRLIRPTHVLFDWKHLKNMQWTCQYFPVLCPAPSGAQHSQDQAGIQISHWDVKTSPQNDSGTSEFNHLGQIFYDSIQEQNYDREGMEVHYIVWCEGNHVNAPSWLKTVPQSTRNPTFHMN